MAVRRVAERVASGGHNIPEATIRQRYGRSIRNFWVEYRSLADFWAVYHNGGSSPRLTAAGSLDREPVVAHPADWQDFLGVATHA
jgi:predicted ABC-type ATPase